MLADEIIASGEILWALVDQVGTIRDIGRWNASSSEFEIANHRVYDSFGNLTYESNSSFSMAYGFTGRWTDPETRLTHHLNRWLDPAIGKWLSNDPIGFGGGDANIQRYVFNNPLAFSDNTGFGIDPGGGGGGGGGDDVMGTSGINQGANQGSSGGLINSKHDDIATIAIDLGGHGPVRGVHKQPRFSGDIASADGGGQNGPQTPLWQGPLIWLYTDHLQVSVDYYSSVRSDAEEGIVQAYDDGIARFRILENFHDSGGLIADGFEAFVHDEGIGEIGRNALLGMAPLPGGKPKNGGGIVGIKGGGGGANLGPERMPTLPTPWGSTERGNYWRQNGRPSGKPPQREVIVRDPRTGEIRAETQSKEVHHIDPRRNAGGNDDDNLLQVWPDEHEEIDRHRRTGYKFITEIPEWAFED